MTSSEIQIELNDEVLTKLEERAAKHGFESVEAYIAVIIETVLNELEKESSEESAVEGRLKDLGYL